MDYEKKYKEANDKVAVRFGTNVAKEIFADLYESEDEKIRKSLIKSYTNQHSSNFPTVDGFTREQILDWLEKQGEPQPYKGNSDTMRKNLIKAFKSVGSKHWGGFDVRDIIHFLESKDAIELEKQGEKPQKTSIWKHWKNGIAGNGDGKLIYLVKTGNTYNLCSCISFECDYIELSELDNLMFEKQGEKKYAPKYNIGDTIYFNSFGKVKSMIVANIVDDGDNNPMYEDADGSSIFENDIIKKKPAWSEEDEKMLKEIVSVLEGNNVHTTKMLCEYANWLKSLKPQSHWKPTKEQINALLDCVNLSTKENFFELNSLYEQLVKL